jgi:hypothetical protein
MSFLDQINFVEKAREKKRRKEFLESLTPEQRGTLFDAAVDAQRKEFAAEKAGYGAGFDRAVDFARNGVASSFAPIALAPMIGFEGAALAAGGVVATSMSASAILTAQEKWTDYKASKLEQAATPINRKLFVSDSVTYDPSDATFKAATERRMASVQRVIGLSSMSVSDMQGLLKERTKEKEVVQADPQRPPMQFEGAISAGKTPEQAIAKESVDPVEAARQKQALAREAAQQLPAQPAPALQPETQPAPALQPQAPSVTPDVAAESGGAEAGPTSRVQVGKTRNILDLAKQSIAWGGVKLQDNNGKPVIETKDALLAPAVPFMNDDQRRERVDAMVDHAASKFAGKPLRLDGNEKFVAMAAESALARGLTVEVPEKHRKLVEEIEQRLTAQKKVAVADPEIEGAISAGTAPERVRAPEIDRTTAPENTTAPGRITGRLTALAETADERGLVMVTIQRAGASREAWVPASDNLKELVGKPVRFEPATPDQPARLVGLERQKQQQQSRAAGRELER